MPSSFVTGTEGGGATSSIAVGGVLGGKAMAVRLLGSGEELAPVVGVPRAPVPEPAQTRWRRRFVPKAASAICDSLAIGAAMLLAYILGDISSIRPVQQQ